MLSHSIPGMFRTVSMAIFTAVVTICGCSQGKELAPVKGEVLQYGIGVKDVWVEFHPEFPEESAVFMGRTNEMGQFELMYTGNAKGATVGKYTVRIGTGGLPDPAGGDTTTPRVQLLEQTGVEVQPGENELLFEVRGELKPSDEAKPTSESGN